jgi:hypothetical protein
MTFLAQLANPGWVSPEIADSKSQISDFRAKISNAGMDFRNTPRIREIGLGNPPVFQPMKAISILLIIASLVVSVDAKPGRRGGQPKRDKAEEKREEEERKAREKKRDAIQEYLRKKDKNNDGSLTREEFQTGESDAKAADKKFDQYNKNGDRSLSKSEIEDLLGL